MNGSWRRYGTVLYCIYLYGFKGGIEITEHTPSTSAKYLHTVYIAQKHSCHRIKQTTYIVTLSWDSWDLKMLQNLEYRPKSEDKKIEIFRDKNKNKYQFEYYY